MLSISTDLHRGKENPGHACHTLTVILHPQGKHSEDQNKDQNVLIKTKNFDSIFEQVEQAFDEQDDIKSHLDAVCIDLGLDGQMIGDSYIRAGECYFQPACPEFFLFVTDCKEKRDDSKAR